MRFGAPVYLWLLPVLPVLAGLFALQFHRRRRALEVFGDLALMRRLSWSASLERRVIKVGLTLGAALFLILALARPQWGARLETVSRKGVDVIVAVDTSLSMLTEDVKPNRLAAARAAVSSLLDLLQGDRIGLVAFAGKASVACPLTLDYAAAAIFVDLLDPNLIPVPGTALAQAVTVSARAFRTGERRNKVLILITDGEDHEGDVESAVRAAADEGVTIYTVGVGTPNGEPIPLRNARGEIVGYKEDRQRRKVTSRLDESLLVSIASSTGGKYFRSTAEGIELRKIYEEVAGMDRTTLSSRLHTAYEERYQYPLAAAILLLTLEAGLSERRRGAAADRESRREAAA
jgi:Ca-activated chloride channel family protein